MCYIFKGRGNKIKILILIVFVIRKQKIQYNEKIHATLFFGGRGTKNELSHAITNEDTNKLRKIREKKIRLRLDLIADCVLVCVPPNCVL